MMNDELMMKDGDGITAVASLHSLYASTIHHTKRYYCPNGVVISVPGGGLNSKVEGEIGARVWFE